VKRGALGAVGVAVFAGIAEMGAVAGVGVYLLGTLASTGRRPVVARGVGETGVGLMAEAGSVVPGARAGATALGLLGPCVVAGVTGGATTTRLSGVCAAGGVRPGATATGRAGVCEGAATPTGTHPAPSGAAGA